MDLSNRQICIVGTGGFGRETLTCAIDQLASSRHSIEDSAVFMVDDAYYDKQNVMGIPVIKRSDFVAEKYEVVVAIGDPATRKRIVDGLPADTVYTSIVHPTAVISERVEIGEGSIVTAGTILTCNIKVGRHAHLNLHTTVGHDCQFGDFFTTAPGANISGECVFGRCVYFGTNSAVRQGVRICDNVTIGMGGVVVKDIDEPGVYIGNPVRRLQQK
jgi:sugar O-acyltransferase (sialic acid O-acetyltransferase NeuD family)